MTVLNDDQIREAVSRLNVKKFTEQEEPWELLRPLGASVVRYRACGLLANSLQREAIPALKSLLNHPDTATRDDAAAAIMAIDKQNHHLFRDRDQSGKVQWILNPEDQTWH